MKSGVSRLALITLAMGLAAPAAMAQEGNPFFRGRHVSVVDRPQPEYDPLPLRAGAFNIYSALNLGAEYNSNVFVTPDDQENDTVIRVRPTIDVASNWSSHELAAGVAANHREYSNFDTESATDYSAYIRGGLDVTRELTLNASLTGARVTEPRYEVSAQNLVGDPSVYDQTGAQATANYRRDRIQLTGTVGMTESTFDRPDMRFRDMTENYVSARGAYAVSPDVAVFVQGRVSEIDFDLLPPPNDIDRDATRTDVRAGVSFELQAPFRGEIGVGVVEEDKSSPTLVDTEGLSLDGRLQWFPTQLTTVEFRARRAIYDPGIFDDPTAIDTNGTVRVDHELLRNIILFGEVGFGEIEFEQSGRSVNRQSLGLGAGYRMNRHVRVDFNYIYNEWDAYDPLQGGSLDQHIAGVSLRLTP